MGSTLLTLRTLLENQISVETATSATDPTKTLLNSYINTAIRKIVRRDKPRELMIGNPETANIVINQNTVAIPATILVVTQVWYQYESGTVRELKQLDMKDLIRYEGETNFFDSTNTGNPIYYAIKGSNIVFNKYFARSATGAVKIDGELIPSTLSNDTDTTELPVDYDMLITYEAAGLFYQRDDDTENQTKFLQLADLERKELRLSLDDNHQKTIMLDPNVFLGRGDDIGNPNIFFSS